MLKFYAQVYRINDIGGWHSRKELTLAPDFQRRSVWSPKGKSFLIDSILRGFPLPQFFIREIVLPREKRTVREVVDGQQRISTILGYMRGEFTVFPSHSDQFARIKYDDLPEEVQRSFLSFPLSVNILEGTEEADVLEIFSRLNAYSVPLNDQEKLNAKYVGSFKRAMEVLAKQHLAFWKRNQILSTQSIARMKDVELTSELVGAMLEGLQNQKKIIADLFKKYDDAFPQSEYVVPRLGETLQLCETLLDNQLPGTIFKRSPLFYSLFCAAYDCTYGLKSQGDIKPKHLIEDQKVNIQEKLIELSSSVEEEKPPAQYMEFYRATFQSQNKLPQRKTMHQVLTQIIASAFEN